MDVFVIVDPENKILAICAEQVEAEEIVEDNMELMIEKHQIINSLRNPWLLPDEERRLRRIEVRLRNQIMDMAWCENVSLREIENYGYILWLEFHHNTVRRNIGLKYMDDHFPDMTFEGLGIYHFGMELPNVTPKPVKKTSSRKKKETSNDQPS